jgi:lipocalin-like protein
MSKFKYLAGMVALLFAALPSFADNQEKVIGIWKLVSHDIEIQTTGQKEPAYGRSPTGYAIFTAEGRVMFVLTGEGRKPAQTVQDRADLLDSLTAYTGMYRVEGNKWITRWTLRGIPNGLGPSRHAPSSSTEIGFTSHQCGGLSIAWLCPVEMSQVYP